MMNKTITNLVNGAGKVIKNGCMIVGPILAAVLYHESTKYTVDEIRYMGKVGYDDAVKAILDSRMYSSDKRKAISMVKLGGSSEYYKSIINTVRSSMWSSDKLAIIEEMCEKENDGVQA